MKEGKKGRSKDGVQLDFLAYAEDVILQAVKGMEFIGSSRWPHRKDKSRHKPTKHKTEAYLRPQYT